MNVSAILTRTVVTVGPYTTVAEIARLMRQHRIGAMPVVDVMGHLAGIVSDHDLLRHPPKDSPRAGLLRLFDRNAVCLEDIVATRHRTAHDVMTRHVTTVSAEAPLGVLGSLMRRLRRKHVPVIHGGKLVGIVSRSDLLDALLEPHVTRDNSV